MAGGIGWRQSHGLHSFRWWRAVLRGVNSGKRRAVSGDGIDRWCPTSLIREYPISSPLSCMSPVSSIDSLCRCCLGSFSLAFNLVGALSISPCRSYLASWFLSEIEIAHLEEQVIGLEIRLRKRLIRGKTVPDWESFRAQLEQLNLGFEYDSSSMRIDLWMAFCSETLEEDDVDEIDRCDDPADVSQHIPLSNGSVPANFALPPTIDFLVADIPNYVATYTPPAISFPPLSDATIVEDALAGDRAIPAIRNVEGSLACEEFDASFLCPFIVLLLLAFDYRLFLDLDYYMGFMMYGTCTYDPMSIPVPSALLLGRKRKVVAILFILLAIYMSDSGLPFLVSGFAAVLLGFCTLGYFHSIARFLCENGPFYPASSWSIFPQQALPPCRFRHLVFACFFRKNESGTRAAPLYCRSVLLCRRAAALCCRATPLCCRAASLCCRAASLCYRAAPLCYRAAALTYRAAALTYRALLCCRAASLFCRLLRFVVKLLSALLSSHSALLSSHSALLSGRSALLSGHSTLPLGRSVLLWSHSALLSSHSALSSGRSILLWSHSTLLTGRSCFTLGSLRFAVEPLHFAAEPLCFFVVLLMSIRSFHHILHL
ncbi:flagellar attachment zone protein 1-like [Senna tora]|uniref:Flagellar attachment zone protein 1-like n=1 Tax=Senna tora TaxID=362788 RepID=A0A834WR30_9FABA|nr:flagellar attachment zone protein 1-like [Senna tora]